MPMKLHLAFVVSEEGSQQTEVEAKLNHVVPVHIHWNMLHENTKKILNIIPL